MPTNEEKELKRDIESNRKAKEKKSTSSIDDPIDALKTTSIPRAKPFQIDTINRKIVPPVSVQGTSGSTFFLKLHPDFMPSGVLEADPTVTQVLGSASETTLNSYAIPPNTISANNSVTEKAGNVFRIFAAGRYTTDDATATVALKLEFNDGSTDTTYHTITSTGADIDDQPWYIDWTVIVATIGSSGTAESFVRSQINNVGKDSPSTSTQTLDTTKTQTIKLTATWSNGSAGDDITIRNFIVELLN
jgi:hypothetical protein